MQFDRMEKIPSRLRKMRQDLGLTLEKASEKLDISVSQLSRLERGESEITVNQLERFAALYNPTGPALIPTSAPLQTAIVKGAVQAGAWAQSLEWPPDEWYSVSIPKHPLYGRFPAHGLEVRGPSMDRLYPAGSVVIVVGFLDLERQPESDENVIVRRRDRHGLYESTVKTFRPDTAGRPWLWPQSNDPEHQTPIPADADQERIETVEITGLVVSSVRVE